MPGRERKESKEEGTGGRFYREGTDDEEEENVRGTATTTTGRHRRPCAGTTTPVTGGRSAVRGHHRRSDLFFFFRTFGIEAPQKGLDLLRGPIGGVFLRHGRVGGTLCSVCLCTCVGQKERRRGSASLSGLLVGGPGVLLDAKAFRLFPLRPATMMLMLIDPLQGFA